MIMVVRKRKKVVKQRGHRTHGWGSPKKHRGSGSRGGVGNAGFAKKGQQKKAIIMNKGVYIGKYGFKSKTKEKSRYLNIDDLLRIIPDLEGKGLVSKTKEGIVVDLVKTPYKRVLGRGNIDKPYIVKAAGFTKTAEKKITDAGGKVIIS